MALEYWMKKVEQLSIEVQRKLLLLIICLIKMSLSYQHEDVQRLLGRFSDLQVEDPSFFYKIQVNSENQITGFFWRDGSSRIDYDYFGDVLILDTRKYRKENVICAPIFGVNHHGNPILFGCTLLLDCAVFSLRWLFRTFMEAMGHRQPKTLYTEVSEDIASAVEKEFPETKHRISVSFILESAREHQYFGEEIFEDIFTECILGHVQSKQEFESKWNFLMAICGLQEDQWLATVYKSRRKWSHLSIELTFTAGFESMLDTEDYFDLIPSWTGRIATLSDILEQYIKEGEKLRSHELKHDLLCHQRSSEPKQGMKKHAEDIYTSRMFEKFEKEMELMLSLAIEEVSPGPIYVFKLKKDGGPEEEEVSFDCSGSKVSCSCKKFESTGILCCHSLKVLNAKNIFRIPEQYILKRWTKSAKEGLMVKGNSERGNMAEKSSGLHARDLMHEALNVVVKSAAFEEGREIVKLCLNWARKETEDILRNDEDILYKIVHQNPSCDKEEVCCGERHCPSPKRQKVPRIPPATKWEKYIAYH